MDTFYATSAGLCFALLGLWWVVVQFKYETWLSDPTRRRVAYDLSLYFLLPGVMSLASLLATRETLLWQVGFGAAGAIGFVDAVLALGAAGKGPTRAWTDRAVPVLTALLYAGVVAVAISPTLPRDLGLELDPLEVEGSLLVVLIFVGVNLVWRWFFERRPSPDPEVRGP